MVSNIPNSGSPFRRNNRLPFYYLPKGNSQGNKPEQIPLSLSQRQLWTPHATTSTETLPADLAEHKLPFDFAVPSFESINSNDSKKLTLPFDAKRLLGDGNDQADFFYELFNEIFEGDKAELIINNFNTGVTLEYDEDLDEVTIKLDTSICVLGDITEKKEIYMPLVHEILSGDNEFLGYNTSIKFTDLNDIDYLRISKEPNKEMAIRIEQSNYGIDEFNPLIRNVLTDFLGNDKVVIYEYLEGLGDSDSPIRLHNIISEVEDSLKHDVHVSGISDFTDDSRIFSLSL